MIPMRRQVWMAAATLLAVSLSAASADANLFARRVLQQPSDAPAAAPQSEGDALTICCEKPCIVYRHHGRCRKACCTCDPPIQTVLLVKNPADCRCCYVEVPVCIPACCTQPPCVDSRCGLFGRGIVDYEYCCGFRIRVIFRRCGDVVVHYFGS